MMMQKKLRSLDANTSSNQKSSEEVVNVVDFLNTYGDEVVIKYLVDNPELVLKLGDPFNMYNEKLKKVIAPVQDVPDAAHRLSGRIAILSVSEQEKFYGEVTQRYIDYIKLLQDTQQYTAEVKYLDLQALTIDRQIFKVGSGGSSFFGRNTIMELCEVNNLRKPYTQEDLSMYLSEAVSEYSGGEDDLDYAADKMHSAYLRKQKQHHEERSRTLDDRFHRKLEISLGKLKEDSQYKKIYKKDAAAAELLLKGYEASVREKNAQDRADELVRINNQYETVRNYLEKLKVGMVTKYVSGLLQVKAVIVGIELGPDSMDNPFAPSVITVRVAVANGIRNLYVPLSNQEMVNGFISNQIMSASDIFNVLHRWDDITRESMNDRVKRYIVTGNILQAMGDAVVSEGGGQLVKFTQNREGKVFVRNGILLPAEFNPAKHTGGRGASFVMVPAKKCLPIVDRLEHDSKRNEQMLYETTNQIQFTRAQNGHDFLMRVPLDKSWKYVFNDSRLLPFLTDEKGFSNWGNIMVWNATTLKKEDFRAMGAVVRNSSMQDLLDYISEEYKASFKISAAIFDDVKGLLGIDTNDDYGDGIGIEESESGLAQVELKNYYPSEAEAAVLEETTGLEQPQPEAAVEPSAIPSATNVLATELEHQAVLNKERANFDYERKLFHLQKMLLTGSRMAAGGAVSDRQWVMSDFTNPPLNEPRYERFALKPVDGGWGIYDRSTLSFVKHVDIKGIRAQPPYKTQDQAKNAENALNRENLQLLDFMWNHESGGTLDENERERRESVALTILEQLGGLNRLKLFTGMYGGLILENGVSFKMPYDFENPDNAYQKANYVKIILNSLDTYDFECGLVNGDDYKVVAELSGIYDDQLVEIFEEKTGMLLHT